MKRCIRCKQTNEADAVYCERCGFTSFETCRKPSKFGQIGKCILYVLVYFVLQFALAISISFGVAIYSAIVGGEMPSDEAMNSMILWISDISNILFLLGLFIFLKLRQKKFSEEVRIKKFKLWTIPLCIVLGFCANIALSVMSSFIPWPMEWLSEYSESTSSLLTDNFLLNVASICILTGIAEEILFRGIVVTRLRRVFGPVFTVIVSAAVFAVVHLTPTSMPPIFVLAIFLASIFLKYDSIVLPIVIHAFFNFAALVPFPESPLLIYAEAFICLALFILSAYLLLKKNHSTETVNN